PEDRQTVLAELSRKQTHSVLDHKYRIVRPDGSTRWIWERGFPVRNEAGMVTSYAGVAADITEQVQAEEELRRMNEHLEVRVAKRTEELEQTNDELQRASRAKDELLANMSHELRTPLNSILGLSQILLEEQRGSLNDYQHSSLEMIEASGQHLLELI